ncbi:hypothetical protein ABFX02_06G007000 [Erythranthe guttata]
MKLPAILTLCILLATVSAEILLNADFELPPSNWKADSTSPLFPLNENSTIPGWTVEGEVMYATAGADLSLPQNGHAILLGQDGKINQTFTAKGAQMHYLLTFTLARRNQSCSSNAGLVVSAPDNSGQFSLTRKYGKEPWEVYGHKLGNWGGGEAVNLVIQSQAIDADPNSTCWPVVDALSLIAVQSLKQENDNLLLNGGFELGPAFPDFSSEGILLDSEPSLLASALQQWTITGTVKYINAKNYFVPEGKTAVEIVSGISSGVQTVQVLTQDSNYKLEFMMGDANDSCSGDFTVGVTAGLLVQNFTVRSNGTGSAKKYSMAFKGTGPSLTTISFKSYTSTQREDGIFCGPVIDSIVLSSGYRSNLQGTFLFAFLLLAILKIRQLV